MFESICMAKEIPRGESLDLGHLAEALVFYQEVHLIADHEIFKSLVKSCGITIFSTEGSQAAAFNLDRLRAYPSHRP